MDFGKKYSVDRRGTSCIKYDFAMQRMNRDDLLPLWVADMDFKLPEEILEDLHKRIDHGAFGYTDPDEEYFSALNRWFTTHHGYSINPEHVTLGCGIVYGLATGVKAFSEVGDAVIVQQPVYYPFSEVVKDNNRILINNQLTYKDGKYTINFEDLENKIRDNNAKIIIFCSPHNPVGRVWTKEELEKVADICYRHNVVMMVDEIHCDIVYPGVKFTSIMCIDEKYHDNVVLYNSPSKTFNIAGLQPANIIIKNSELRKKYKKANSASGYSQGSLMGQVALKSVYTKGDKWVKELLEYINSNKEYVKKFVQDNFSKAYFVEPEGTYLIWIDFSKYGFTDEELEHIIVDEAKLWLDSGKIFGPETAQFERFNVACARETLEKAMNQLKEAIDNHKKWNE